MVRTLGAVIALVSMVGVAQAATKENQGKLKPPKCTFERAIYVNHGKSDYQLVFEESEGGVRATEFAATLRSNKQALELVGSVMWSNGAARPYISFARRGSEESLYGGEIYGLETNKRGEIINQGFPTLDDPPVKTLLVPNLSAALYNQLRDDFTGDMPADIFYFAKCK